MSLLEPIPLQILAFVKAHWRVFAIALLVMVVAVFGLMKACSKPKVQLDEKELQQVHEAIETRERKKMEDAFVKVEAKQAEIEANVTNAKAATVNAQAEARKKVQAMSDDELSDYLESIK